MLKRKNRLIYILAAVTLVLIAVIYVLPEVSDEMTKTVTAEYGTLEETDSITCYFVRNEKVYAPTVSGSVKLVADEGIKVRRNTKIAEIEEGSTGEQNYREEIEKLGDTLRETSDCRAAINGVVSYMIDGNENIMSFANLKNITFDDVKNMDNSFVNLSRDAVTAGEPLYKIYRNEKWYMLFWTDEETAARYEKGSVVTVIFEDGSVTASVSSVRKQGTVYRVSLKCNRYYSELSDTRVKDATVVTRSVSGLVVPDSCITEEKGVKGVMVRNTYGEFVFKPVNILLDDGEKSIVSSDKYYDSEGNEVLTIKIYDELIRNP